MKSERLKKFEAELNDLEQWMRLGLVPKKELERHKEEIDNLKSRIAEEKERLQFLKESGEVEEFTVRPRGPSKTVYPETPSVSDVEFGETTEAGLEMETESTDLATTEEEKEEGTTTEIERYEEEEDPYSDKKRWERGGGRIIDPDATDW